MLLQLLAINHSNARENGVSTFFRFLHCFVKRVLSIVVADTYHPPIFTIAPPSPEACSHQDLVPRFAERRRCWLWLGQLGTRGRSRQATPPPRALQTSRKEQEFDPATAAGQPQRHNGACRLRHPIDTGRRG